MSDFDYRIIMIFITKGRMFEEDNRGKLSDEDYNKVVDLLTELLYSIGYEVLDNI